MWPTSVARSNPAKFTEFALIVTWLMLLVTVSNFGHNTLRCRLQVCGCLSLKGAQCAMFEGQGFKMLAKATSEEINAPACD